MKTSNLVSALIFLSLAAIRCVKVQAGATGSIDGRVISVSGNGGRRASVRVLNPTTLESRTRLANDFGYFRFDNLPIMDLYLVTVGSKRHSFSSLATNWFSR